MFRFYFYYIIIYLKNIAILYKYNILKYIFEFKLIFDIYLNKNLIFPNLILF